MSTGQKRAVLLSIFVRTGGKREQEKRGLDGRVLGAEGEGANGPPNHVLHRRVILGRYNVYERVQSKCGADTFVCSSCYVNKMQ